jgi:hypothetical protein
MSEYLLIEKKIRDMIVYNNIMLKQFPKHEKYVLAAKIREIGYDLLELAIAANKKYIKKTTFSEFDVRHESIRQLINVAFELQYIDSKKHRISQLKVDEVGRMLGSWIKSMDTG